MIDRLRDCSVNRKTVVVVAIIILCIGSLATIAIATNTVWITSSTDSDFQDADLTNLDIVGSGTSATVERIPPEAGSQIVYERTNGGNTFNDGGWVIEPHEDVGGLELTLMGGATDFNTVEIRRMSDDQLIASEDLADDQTQVSIHANLDANVEYRVYVLSDSGAGSTSPDFPVTSNDFTLISGWDGDSTTTSWVGNIESIQVYTGQQYDTAQYVHTYFVTDPEDARVVIDNVVDMEVTAEWQYHDGTTWQTAATETITTAGTYTRDVSTHSADEWRIVLSADATTSDWKSWSMAMDEEGFSFENTAPIVDNSSAEPNTEELINQTPVDLSIDVSDPDFDSAQGDTVDVEFYRVVDDGSDELVGTHTLGQNGTATATMDEVVAGTNEWYVVARDEHGGETTSDTFSFEAAQEIRVVDEITLELIDDSDANVTVRFFREDSEEVISRDATGGTADMTGLPADTEFVVVANAEGYEPRRVIVSSIVEQSTVYLLSEEEPSVFNEFTLQDDTGSFPDGQTKLIIQKAITTDEDNETQTFQTIAGDYFGATGTFPVVLAAQDRYRLIIENDDGQRRSLGSHTAEAGGPMPISVGQIEWPAPDQLDWGFSADYISDEDGTYIDIMYNDSSGDTSFLDLRVHERGNESNIIHEEATSDPSEFRVMVPLEGNQTQTEWVVEYTITRNGETSTYSYIVGGDHEWQLPFDSELMSLLGLIGAVVIMAAYPGPLAPVGGIVVVGVSGVLLLVGIINIPIGAWFLAGTIAVLGIVKAAEGVRFG